MITRRPPLIVEPFPTIRLGAMNVANHILGVCNTVLNVDGHYMCVHREFSLEADSQEHKQGADRTYLEVVEDPDEIQLPCGDCVFIILHMETVENKILLVQPFYARLDICHVSVMGMVVTDKKPYIHPPLEGRICIGSGKPRVGVIYFVSLRIS